MKKELFKTFLFVFCLITNGLLYAQPGDTDGTPTDNLEGTDPPASIDSLLLVLVVLALAFGFYMLHQVTTKHEQVK